VKRWFPAAVVVIVLGAAGSVFAQQRERNDPAEIARLRQLFASIPWQHGPAKVRVGDVAEIQVPAGYMLTGPQGANTWFELTQNPPDPHCLGVLTSERPGWFVIFSYRATGYVRDDEKGELIQRSDEMLTAIREGAEQSNDYRRGKGWPEVHILGWQTAPNFDDSIKKLTWATRLESEGHTGVNFDIRVLSRGGVMQVELVCSPEQYAEVSSTVKRLIDGFDFTTGNKYAEFHAGDKVATYGLTGLITAGGVLAAAKTGLLAKLAKLLLVAWKAIAIGAVAVLAWLRQLFFGRRQKA
jgi:uncharacterized membrane-anchored protein